MTKIFRIYMLRFAFRIFIFTSVLLLYIADRELLEELMLKTFFSGINLLHILWLIFMVIMISHIFPFGTKSMALLREGERYYKPEQHSELSLLRFIQEQNRKAWKVMLIWLFMNGVIGALYLFGVLGNAELLLITTFFFLSDYICILIFCPFQTFVMKNRCCINCRIYDWGHFMMFTPMLFIRNFFSWSLFFTSCVVLIHWELCYAKNPERFWQGSNSTLKCSNCGDRTCLMKKSVNRKLFPGKLQTDAQENHSCS